MFAIVVFSGCADTSDDHSSPALRAARLLVHNDTGKQPSLTDPTVIAVARHVASLDRKCRGSAAEVYGSVDFASTDLATNGIHQTRRDLAARLDKNITGFPANFDCQGFVAAYLITREQDHSLKP